MDWMVIMFPTAFSMSSLSWINYSSRDFCDAMQDTLEEWCLQTLSA